MGSRVKIFWLKVGKRRINTRARVDGKMKRYQYDRPEIRISSSLLERAGIGAAIGEQVAMSFPSPGTIVISSNKRA